MLFDYTQSIISKTWRNNGLLVFFVLLNPPRIIILLVLNKAMGCYFAKKVSDNFNIIMLI